MYEEIIRLSAYRQGIKDAISAAFDVYFSDYLRDEKGAEMYGKISEKLNELFYKTIESEEG